FERPAAVQRQPQAIVAPRHHLLVLLEALRFLRPFGPAVAAIVGVDWSATRHAGLWLLADRLRARSERQQAHNHRQREREKDAHHRLGFSMVSRLIDRKVASAISSISRSTRCSTAPMSVSSPGSLARWPGAGSNRATMSIRVVRRRLPMKR